MHFSIPPLIPRPIVRAFAVIVTCGTLGAVSLSSATPPPSPSAQWIWFPETPAEKTSRYFRKTIAIDAPIEVAIFHLAADDFAFFHVNGRPAQPSGFGLGAKKYDLSSVLVQGDNTLAFKVNNSKGDAGLLAYGEIILRDGRVIKVATDSTWKTTDAPPDGESTAWTTGGFDDGDWLPARVLAPADSGPWRSHIKPELFKDQGITTGPRQPIPSANLGRITIDDFSDTSSWMGGPQRGHLPGSGNPFPFSFGTAAEPRPERDDRHCGEFVFHFVEPDGRARFEKNAALLLKVVPAAIEFDANPLGHEAEIHFEFVDKRNTRTFATSPVRIGGNAWQRHRLALDATTIKDHDAIIYPIALRNLYITVKEPVAGRILIDDLAYEADITRHGGSLEARPNYTTIAHAPGSPVRFSYRVRNRQAVPRTVQATLAIYDAGNRQVSTHRIHATIPGNALQNLTFDLVDDPLPVGPYRTELRFDDTGSETPPAHFGWFGIFTPNGRRINTTPMWFGIEDQEIRNAPAETGLHVSWMRALGIDLARSGMIGGMIEARPGNSVGFNGYSKLLEPFFNAGIDILMEYAGGVPAWTYPPRSSGRDQHIWDLDLFHQHMTAIGRFIAGHPGIKYFEFLNEPDLHHFSTLEIDEYLASLRVVYEALKAEAPALKVTTGGVAAGHPRAKPGFSQTMFQQGRPWYDVAAFHSHGPPDDYQRIQNNIQSWLAQVGENIPIGNTEAGFRSYQGNHALFIKQAEVLVQKIAIAKTGGSEFYVWFMLQDYWDKYINADDSFGLVTVDNQPKPSFVAYNELIRQLANSRPAGTPIQLDPRLETHHYQNDTEDIFVCWPRNRQATFLVLSATAPVTYTSIWGNGHLLTPVRGIINHNTTALPFYLRALRGALTPARPLAIAIGDTAIAPGETGRLSVEINNPVNAPIRGTLATDAGTVALDLAPLAAKRIQIPVTAPADAAIGPHSLSLATQIVTRDGNPVYAGDISISYEVCLPIPRVPSRSPAGSVLDSPQIVTETVSWVRELAFDPNTPRWAGPEDLSARIRLTWDNPGLRIRAQVRDQDISFPRDNEYTWLNDCLQIAILGAKGDQTEITLTKNSKGQTGIWCHISGKQNLTGAWDLPATVETTPGRIDYDVTIPFERIGVRGERGEAFRLSFAIVDNDGGGRLRVIEWGGGIQDDKNPDRFNWVRLE